MTVPPENAQRFTSRVPYYHIYRPHYPRAVTDLMAEKMGLTNQSSVADIGAGTGISSELFLSYGCTVYAVEPNEEMRAVAVGHYGDVPGFRAVDGTADATSLANASVDFVVAGQAFHWFNPRNAKLEFARILKPGGYIVLFWNERTEGASPFLDAFNRVMTQFDTDKNSARTQEMFAVGNDLSAVFSPEGYTLDEFENPVSYGWEALLGRALSSSYAPLHDHPNHLAFVEGLRAVFEAHQTDGLVWMNYTTRVYWGKP